MRPTRLARAATTAADGTALDLGRHLQVGFPSVRPASRRRVAQQPALVRHHPGHVTGVMPATTRRAPLRRPPRSISGRVTEIDTGRGTRAGWVVDIGPTGIAGEGATRPDGGTTIGGRTPGTPRITRIPSAGHARSTTTASADHDGATPIAVAAGAPPRERHAWTAEEAGPRPGRHPGPPGPRGAAAVVDPCAVPQVLGTDLMGVGTRLQNVDRTARGPMTSHRSAAPDPVDTVPPRGQGRGHGGGPHRGHRPVRRARSRCRDGARSRRPGRREPRAHPPALRHQGERTSGGGAVREALERMASPPTTNTSEDIREVVSALRREEPAIRLLGWAILAGYPIEKVWPDYPAFQKVQTVLTDEQERSAAGATGRTRASSWPRAPPCCSAGSCSDRSSTAPPG